MRSLKGVILAQGGGADELARTVSGACPHVLPLANRPLVHYAADAMRACGVRDVAVVVAPGTHEEVRRAVRDGSPWDLRISYVERREMTLGDVLAAARAALGEGDLLVHRGDGLFAEPLDELVGHVEAPVPDGLLLLERMREPDSPARALRVVGSRRIPAAQPDLAPAFVLSGRALEEATQVQPRTTADLAASLGRRSVPLEVRTVSGAWSWNGDVDALLQANRMVLDALVPEVTDADLAGARIEGRVSVHPTAVLDRTTVRGPAVIGAGAVLTDTFVGPYTAIGQDVRVEGTEIEHSIVLAGASIRNLGRRLEGSLVGREASVGRQFSLPAGLRLRVGRGSEISLD